MEEQVVDLGRLEVAVNTLAKKENAEKINAQLKTYPGKNLRQILEESFSGNYLLSLPQDQSREGLTQLRSQNRIPEKPKALAEWLLRLAVTDEEFRLAAALCQLGKYFSVISRECRANGINLIHYLSCQKKVYKRAHYLLNHSEINVTKLSQKISGIVDTTKWLKIVKFYKEQQAEYAGHLENLLQALNELARVSLTGKPLADIIHEESQKDYSEIAYLSKFSENALQCLADDMAKLENRRENINPEDLKQAIIASQARPLNSQPPQPPKIVIHRPSDQANHIYRAPTFWNTRNAGQKAAFGIATLSGLTGIAGAAAMFTSLKTLTIGTVINTLGFKFVLGSMIAGTTVPIALFAAATALLALALLTYMLSSLAKCGKRQPASVSLGALI